MLYELLTILPIFSLFAMLLVSPGPDFVIVTKYALSTSRAHALYASFGVALGTLFHMSYCLLGAIYLINEYDLISTVIKYIGATYLIYLGVTSLMVKVSKSHSKGLLFKPTIKKAFIDGLLCNVLNVKASFFFIIIFTALEGETDYLSIRLIFCSAIVVTTMLWFGCLSLLFTHRKYQYQIQRYQHLIHYLLGLFLIVFGISWLLETE